MKHYKLQTIDNVHLEQLKEAFDNYDAITLNIMPYSEHDLYSYYNQNIDRIYQNLRNLLNDSVFVVANEIRAMLGHLADYHNDKSKRRNLEKAYGHFRRMNIDTFKVLCDELDEYLYHVLCQFYHYDFRNKDSKFLYTFSKDYFAANHAYKEAQNKEKTGSDMAKDHNILAEYHEASKKYVNLFCYYYKLKPQIIRAKRWKVIRRVIAYAISIFCVVMSILLPALSN